MLMIPQVYAERECQSPARPLESDTYEISTHPENAGFVATVSDLALITYISKPEQL
jgi:hypothetical protein